MIQEVMKLSKTSQNLSSNISVSDTVLKLVAGILHSHPQQPKEMLLAKLLANIDSSFFPPRLSTQPATFDHILKTICDYYVEKKQERVVKKFLAKKQYCDRFVHTFELIFDLALTGREEERDNYLDEIMKMTEQQRFILNNLIYDLERRTFIGQLKDPEKDIIEFKDEEYHQLYKEFEDLQYNYLALNDNYEELKRENEKIVNRLNQMQQEKQFLCQQIGLDCGSTYREMADKYCEDMQNYTSCYEDFQRELASKSTLVSLKQKQIEALNQLLTSDSSSMKSDEAKQAIANCKELQHVIAQQHKENLSLQEQVSNQRKKLEEAGEELEKKEEVLNTMKVYREKFLQAKSLHQMFKNKFEARMNFPNQEGSFAV